MRQGSFDRSYYKNNGDIFFRVLNVHRRQDEINSRQFKVK